MTDLTPITRAPGTGRTVALTFDDGPGDDTAALLEVLRADDVHATFFSIGAHAAAMPDLVAREAAGGNLVGDHTWDHLYPRQLPGGWTVPYLTDQLTRTDAVVSRQTGEPVCWFRPPGGFLTSSVWTVTRRLGLHVVMWSVDPQDWALQSPARIRRLGLTAITDLIVRRVSVGLSQEHPLILMHDGGGARAATVAAVSRIVALYRAHGYRFVRLDGTT